MALFVCFIFLLCSRVGKSATLGSSQWYSSLLQVTTLEIGFLLLCLYLSYPSLCDTSIICCVEAIWSALSSFSGGNALYVGIYLVCPLEEVISGIFYATMLDPLLYALLYFTEVFCMCVHEGHQTIISFAFDFWFF